MRSYSILANLLALACATHGYSDATVDSLRASVKQVLARYGSDSFPVRYAFGPGDFMRPGNPKASGWGPTLQRAWLYAPNMEFSCVPVEDIRINAEGLRGRVIQRKSRHGDTTFLTGWDMVSEGQISFFDFSYALTRTGDTAEGQSGGNAETGGSLGHVSRQAIDFDAINVYATAEKGSSDTLFFEDPAGHRLACARISSIDINLTNGTNYHRCSAPGRKNQSRTLPRASLPPKCPVDTGEILLREITEAIGDFGFTVSDADNEDHEALFRSRADCKRYAAKLARRKR
jgi:hypothetical protein